MTDSILQSFLDNRFIKTDDPEHIEKLKKASFAIQKLLKKKKPKIISYTLAALDPTITDDDPVVVEVETLIIKQWSTFRNSVAKTKDTPIAYVQAVILDALNKLSDDENFAAIIWHTGCNILSYYKLAGQEEVLTYFLLEIGKKVEEVGRKNWSILENAKINTIDPIKLNLPKVSQGKVDEAELKGHLGAAAIHSGWNRGGENPAMPGQNNPPWSKFFAERAAKGLSEEINAALSAQNSSLTSIANSIHKSIDSYFSNLKPYLETISSSILQSSQSLNKRSDLLWWKQALYSTKLDAGYRKLGKLTMAIVAVAMAVDLADNVSPIHPKSVDYFLEETLRDVLGDETDSEVVLAELLKQLQQSPDAVKQLLEDLCNENEGRKSFGACLADIMKEQMNVDDFFKHTGLEKRAQISLGAFTIWLFHDLQANTLSKMR